MPANRIVINGVEQIDPRHTRAWRRLRQRVLAEEPTCRLRLEGCTLVSTVGAHIISVKDRPDLALERSNVRGTCAACNRASGTLADGSFRTGTANTDGWYDEPSPALSIFRREVSRGT